ncbi:hypothetical protein D3C79_873660 [compost metagenome]
MPPQIAVFSRRAEPPRIASIGAPATTLYDTYRKAPSNQWLAPASCWLAIWSRAVKLRSRVNTAYNAIAVAARIRKGVTAPINTMTF